MFIEFAVNVEMRVLEKSKQTEHILETVVKGSSCCQTDNDLEIPVRHHFRGDFKAPHANEDRTVGLLITLYVSISLLRAKILCFIENNSVPFHFEHDSFVIF
jgi:hypothetical protein